IEVCILLDHFQRAGTIVRLIGRVTHLVQIGRRGFEQIRFVIYYEYFAGQFRARTHGDCGTVRSRDGLGEWKIEGQRRTLAGLAVNADGTAGLLDETVDHRKTKASSFAARLGGEKGLEDTRKCFLRHATSRIRY